jgi:predicted permease
MIQDLRQGLRMLLQSKGWTAMVVLSLALGIGANTAIFSAVNGLLLRKLPVEDPDTLVRLTFAGQNEMANSTSGYGNLNSMNGVPMRASFPYPMFQQLRKDNQTMTDMFAGAPVGVMNVVVDGQAEIATAYLATGNFHGMLGVKAVIGRPITPDDDNPSSTPVAAISHAFWTRRFGRDAGVVGKVVQVNNVPVTIVGVISPEFTGIQRVVSNAPDLFLPLALDTRLTLQGAPGAPPRLSQATTYWLEVMGRLKPGVTPQQVQGNLEGVFQQTARQGMDSYLASLPAEERASSQNQNRSLIPRLVVDSGARGVYDPNPNEIRVATILSVVVGLILLIVCANVANLLLSRAAARQKEISVRLSLGATRVRLIRQLLTESILLAFIGAVLGIAVAYWGRQLLPSGGAQAALDWRVLAFAGAVALMTGILFGIAPALRTTRTNVSQALKENSRSVAGSRSLLSRALLVVQVAVSLVLLVGAGLFLRTVQNLRQVDVGFQPQNLASFRLSPQLNGYQAERISSLFEQIVERLKAVPGIRDVTLSNPALLTGSVNGTNFVVQGRTYTRGPHNDINRLRVAPNFFDMMGIPLLTGRVFTPQDGPKAPLVAVINEAAVRKFFPNENPLGRRFGGSPENSGQMEVVGVVRDAKYSSIRDEAPPTMYVPYTQSPVRDMFFEVRTAADPGQAVASIRETIRQVDANVPLMNVSTKTEQIDQRLAQERLFAQTYALFGALALLLASIGLFGLMSYNVARRTNEIGIRMALGARRWDVVQMVMRESLLLVAIGVAIGFAAALAAGRLVATLLFGLAPTDTITIALAIGVMIVVSSFAGYLPARRASRVDPVVALHHE